MDLLDLIKEFTLDAIKHAVFMFDDNKALGLDGFSFAFFKGIDQLWEKICWHC